MTAHETPHATEEAAVPTAAVTGEQPTEPATRTVVDTAELVALNRRRSRQRALEYQTQSLSDNDPLEACLSSQAATQFRLATSLEERIDEMLATSRRDESLSQLDRLLKHYVQLAREVSHHAVWKIRAAENRQRTECAADSLSEVLQHHFAPPTGAPAPAAAAPTPWELFR